MIVGHNTTVVSTLAAAGMLATFAADVLSDFERHVLGEVSERFLEFGPDTQLTDGEWDIVSTAARAMAERCKAKWEVAYSFPRDDRGVPSLRARAG